MKSIKEFSNECIRANVTSLIDRLLSLEPFMVNHIENRKGRPEKVVSWYIVTPILARILIDEGEIVLDAYSHYFWGIATYGQLIEDNPVLGRIYKKTMEGN